MKKTILMSLVLCGAVSLSHAQSLDLSVTDEVINSESTYQRGRGDDRGDWRGGGRGDGRGGGHGGGRGDDRGRGGDDWGRGDGRGDGGGHGGHRPGRPGRPGNPGRPGHPGYPPVQPPQRYYTEYVSCYSYNYQGNQCPFNRFNIQSIRIVQQHTPAACIWNRTAGVLDGFVWVSNGCAATFEIVRYR